MTSARYVVHMGPFKTGSTYLQHCLTSARGALAAQGINYPDEFISPKNKTMHKPLRDSARLGRLAMIQRRFRTIEEAGHHTIVFSCEHFIRLNAGALTILRDATGGRPIEVVYYARRWSDRLASLWGQTLLTGGTLTLPQFCMRVMHAQAADELELIDYAISLDRLSGVFGREALRIVPYSAQIDAKDDIFGAFCRDILGLTEAPAVPQQGKTLWGALDLEHSEILRGLNLIHVQRTGKESEVPRTQFLRLRKNLDLTQLEEAIRADKADLLLDDSHATFAPARERLAAYADRIVASYRDRPMLPPRARLHPYVSGAYLLSDGVITSLQQIYAKLVAEPAERVAVPASVPPAFSGKTGETARSPRQNGPPPGVTDTASAGLAEAALRTAMQGASKHNSAELLAKLEQFLAVYPEHLPAYLECAKALVVAGDKAAAFNVAKTALARAPGTLDVRLAYVEVALAAGEHAAAQEELDRLEAEHPRNQNVPAARIQLLLQTNDFAHADTLARRALSSTPQSLRAWKTYARIAAYQGDWQAVRDRWEEARPHLPDKKPQIDAQVKAARFQLNLQPEAPLGNLQPESEVFARFESLGGGKTGCEFGLVQRRFDFESIGLLRWASIGIDSLIDGLDSGFEGIGEERQTVLIESSQGYNLRDTRYQIFTHTFVKISNMPADRMLAQSCRRLKFLGTKLLEDIATGEKLFTYKLAPNVDEADISRLFVSLRKRGPGALLCFAIADDQNAPGTWKCIEPGLFVGFIQYFMSSTDSKQLDLPAYAAVCRGVVSSLKT